MGLFTSASLNRGPENIRVLPVVIPELELCDVERLQNLSASKHERLLCEAKSK